MSEALKNNTESVGDSGQASQWDTVKNVPFNPVEARDKQRFPDARRYSEYLDQKGFKSEYASQEDFIEDQRSIEHQDITKKYERMNDKYQKANLLQKIKMQITGERAAYDGSLEDAERSAVDAKYDQQIADLHNGDGANTVYPDQIDDIDKARAMAEAENAARDKYSNKIKDLREDAEIASTGVLDETENGRDRRNWAREAEKLNDKADKLQDKIDRAADRAAANYDKAS